MSRIATVLAVVALIVVLNVVPRVVDLPAIDLPDIPAIPDWLQVLNKIKNVLIIGFVVLVVVGAIAKDARRRRG